MIILLAALRLLGFLFEPGLAASEIHAVAGEPARVNAPRGGELTLVTWNIERGVAFERIVEVLDRLDADVVVLQEVDRFCSRSSGRDVAGDLAARLSMNWVAAGEFQEIGEAVRGRACVTGQAILSRTPITETSVVRFEDQATLKWRLNPAQPRRGARIALRARTGGVVAYSVHLESGGNAARRARQVADITADADASVAPVIVAGDFNAESNETALFANLKATGFAVAAATDAANPVQRRPIDFVFARGIHGTTRVFRADDASDHDPVIARFATGGGSY